ncbi:MAG: carboxypeptidase regulatory-like domain-containing protein, partial [Bryobacteraceae bacterium]
MSTATKCFSLLFVVLALPCAAQEVTASITGAVTDATGAAVANATVTATDVDRGTVYPTQTNQEGIYFYPRIPAGQYELKFEAPGFKTATRAGVLLEVNQRARLNLTLEVGQVTESVEVTGELPLLSTDTTLVGSTVQSTTLVNTPLASRNFTELTLLTPGTVTTNLAGMRNSERTGYGAARPYVNGNRAQANNFLLDGIDNNQVSDNYTAYQPNVDAIQEVNTITNNAPAEFGNFQGAIINVVMKGGTNEYHGSLFEFFQNDKLNANNWARNWQGFDRAPTRLNNFGGTFGGPVIIPGVLNGKDKLFFFVNYQGIRRSNPGAPSTISVIPAEFRQGDFSRLLTEQNPPIQLYDPLALDASGQRIPFANNQIPVSRMDPVARNLFSNPDLYPLPINSGLRFNQVNQGGSRLVNDQGDAKIDYKPTVNDNLYFRYSQGQQDTNDLATFPLIFPAVGTSPFKAGVLNWTRTFTPTVVNEARFGINRITFDNGGSPKDLGNVAEELGIVGANDRGPGLPEFRFTTGGLASNIGRTNVGTQALFANTTFHIADNLTWIKGRHMFKMGGQVLRQRMNTLYTGNNGRTGFIQWDGRFTGRDVSQRGLAEADFFLGAVSRTGRGVTGLWGHRKTILGFYFQDDWRATESLTLNLGLRWEWHQPLYEVYDRQANFEPFTGRLLLAGQDGNSRALYKPFNKDFQPRIGFAYTPGWLGKRTVFRGAYTISSYMEGSGTNLRLPIN